LFSFQFRNHLLSFARVVALQHLDFARKLIGWYEHHQRQLPWRTTTDPYRIWLSEIILQQTRVAQGLPYYERFVEAFPTVQALAAAPLPSVLRLWQGLGYYSRARNLHKCAQEIVTKHGGNFPRQFQELKTLPGIGPYTAAAIASLAFKEPVAVVDGNVFRVLARVFGLDQDTASPAGRDFFFQQANQLLDQQRPDLFNQALMEFGALHCTPQQPRCNECIFEQHCFARLNSLQQALPVKLKKQKVRTRHLHYVVLVWNNKLLLRTRTERDIWQGLNDFWLAETPRAKTWQRLQEDLAPLPAEVRKATAPHVEKVRHVLSHQVLHVRFYRFDLKKEWKKPPPGFRWYTARQVDQLPKPIVITRYLEAIGYL
jgi:A/G-specific adenine glycosylase